MTKAEATARRITTEREALDLEYGSRVYVKPRYFAGGTQLKPYSGVLILCWLCVDEPAFDVQLADGEVRGCFPLTGDEVTVLSE